ncbi:MAG: hypothetical protein L3J36_15750 [Rhodobacteraceae bacterium]|nr:hypothetical protein [Paracoccaceae bacterium]
MATAIVLYHSQADMQINALIFDVDGPLSETEDVHLRAFNKADAVVACFSQVATPDALNRAISTGDRHARNAPGM